MKCHRVTAHRPGDYGRELDVMVFSRDCPFCTEHRINRAMWKALALGLMMLLGGCLAAYLCGIFL